MYSLEKFGSPSILNLEPPPPSPSSKIQNLSMPVDCISQQSINILERYAVDVNIGKVIEKPKLD